jgi:NADH:ubiquinone oxidoreductase subunit E
MPRITTPNELAGLRSKPGIGTGKVTHTLAICNGTGCQASRSAAVVECLKSQLSEQGLEEKIRIRVTGCEGFCEQGPVVVVSPGDVFYCRGTPLIVRKIRYRC